MNRGSRTTTNAFTVTGRRTGIPCSGGALLLTQAMRATGLDRGMTAALERWRAAVHDPGRSLLTWW